MFKFTLYTTLLFLFGVTVMEAQPQKGDVLIGAFTQVTPGLYPVTGLEIIPNRLGFGVYTQKSTYTTPFGKQEYETSILGFNASPDVGYFFTDHLMAGLHGTLLYSRAKEKESEDTDQVTIFQIGPMVRYFIPMQGPFQFSVGGAYSYGVIKTKYEYDGDSESDSNNLSGFTAGIGGDYFIRPNVSLGTRLEYQFSKISDKEGSVEYKDTTGGIGFRVGIQVFLGRKSLEG